MRPCRVAVALCALAAHAHADITVWRADDRYLALGMLLQVQARVDRSDGPGLPGDGLMVFPRRLRPSIGGAFDRDWYAILEIDFGLGFDGQDPKTSIKSAYLDYTGFADDHQTSLKIGSIKPAFGSEFRTSSARLLTTELSVDGIAWYGTPDMTMGVGLTHMTGSRKLSAEIVAGTMSVRQRPDRLWFQSPQNQTDSSDNTGYLASARLDVWPIGEMPRVAGHPAELGGDRSDLHDTPAWHVVASLAGYGWWNDGNNDKPTMPCPTTNDNVCPDGLTDVRHAYGGELAASLLGHGFAAHAEYHRIRSQLRDGSFAGGLYRRGEADLNKLAVSAGYMIYSDEVELAAMTSLLTATNFPSTWYSNRLAVDWFIREHAIQLSFEVTRNTNALGTTGAREDVGRVQMQLVW